MKLLDKWFEFEWNGLAVICRDRRASSQLYWECWVADWERTRTSVGTSLWLAWWQSRSRSLDCTGAAWRTEIWLEANSRSRRTEATSEPDKRAFAPANEHTWRSWADTFYIDSNRPDEFLCPRALHRPRSSRASGATFSIWKCGTFPDIRCSTWGSWSASRLDWCRLAVCLLF